MIYCELIFLKKKISAIIVYDSKVLIRKNLCMKDTYILTLLVILEIIRFENDHHRPFFPIWEHIHYKKEQRIMLDQDQYVDHPKQ